MTESKRIQPRQIRMSDETKGKIDALAAELGCSTAETIEMLVNEHGLEMTKQTVPEQSASVDQFKAHARGLIHLFENSVQLYAGAKDVARLEFSQQLEAQAVAINAQKEQLEKAQYTIAHQRATIQQLQLLEKEVASLEKTITDKERVITDKEAIIAGHANLEEQLSLALARNMRNDERMDTLRGRLGELEAAANEAHIEARLAEQAKENLNAQLAQARESAERMAAQYDKQVASLERQITASEHRNAERDKQIVSLEREISIKASQLDAAVKRAAKQQAKAEELEKRLESTQAQKGENEMG